MSAADSIGKTPVPVSGPAGVAQIAAGFFARALRGSKKTVYKIGGQRVSGPEFRARVGVVLPGQRPAPPKKMPLPSVAVAPPIATQPSQPGYRPDLTERKIPPLKRTAPPAPPPPGPRGGTGPDRMPVPPRGTPRTLAFAGAWLRRAGYVGTIIFTVEWISRMWANYFPGQPLPDKPPPPRGGPGSQGGKGTNRPQLPPEIVFSPVINVNVPGPRPEPKPKAPPVNPAEGLERIEVIARRVPIPTPVPPAPKPASPISTLLSKYGSSALPFLAALGKQSKKKKKRSSSSPLPGIPGLTPGQNPELGLQPQLADYPLVSGGNYFDSTPSQNCDCGPKKKRKPKKKRTVCYTGRFTEKANGLRKYEKRKITCR